MGKSIISYKIFTAKPHEKIPLRTLSLDVKKITFDFRETYYEDVHHVKVVQKEILWSNM
jgi:hypothetical protein